MPQVTLLLCLLATIGIVESNSLVHVYMLNKGKSVSTLCVLWVSCTKLK